MPESLLTAIGLIAVSSSEQLDGVSLDEQERAIRQRCTQEGWHLLEPLIILPGVSRSDPDIVGIFTSPDPKYKPYHRVREQINTQAADILIAYDDGRVGRSKSMFVYIAENAIANGMRVLVLDSGWIDADNQDFAILLGSIKATANMKRFGRMRVAGMPRRVAKGLPSASPVLSHKIVRDDKGRAVTLALDESKRRLLDDLATVLLEGHAYDTLQNQLYHRFGHVNQETGKRFGSSTFRKLLYNPYFWGHAAIGHATRNLRNGPLAGWAYDESIDPPPGITIYRNTHPPAYTGDLAVRIKAEMRRREGSRGAGHRHGTLEFTRFLYCNECKGRLYADYGYYKNIRYGYWRCRTAHLRKYHHYLPECTQRGGIRADDVREYIRLLLQQIYDDDDLRLFQVKPNAPQEHLARIDAEIVDVRSQLDQLIEDYSKERRPAVREVYAQKIDDVGNRLEILEAARVEHIRANQGVETLVMQQQEALNELRTLGVEGVMAYEPAKFNQYLFMLFGKFRLFVENHAIVKLKEVDR